MPARAGPRRSSNPTYQGRRIGNGEGRKWVGAGTLLLTGTLLLNSLPKEARGQGAVAGPSRVSESSRVAGPLSSDIPKIWTFVAWADTMTPFLPINLVVNSG